MLSKILPQHFSVWFRLLCGPTAVKIIPAFLGLPAVVNNGLAQQKPEFKDRQGFQPIKIIAGIIADDLFFKGVH